MKNSSLLIELGTEELPPKALKTLSNSFHKEILDGLLAAELICADDSANAQRFATPRRLAIVVPNVIEAQPDQSIERRGPAVQAAFKDDGSPSPAAMGFAKSCGTTVENLDRLETDKGQWLSYKVVEKGKSLHSLVPEILEQTVKRLPIAKRMRWGDSEAEFVRPVKWLNVLYGSETIPMELLGVTSDNTSRGHRFHCQGELSFTAADEYEATLEEKGHVIASFERRQNMISEQIHKAAKSVNGHIQLDAALLDEVTGLVEYPSPVIGSFDSSFLEVPQECLISSMRDHQKYFHIVDADEKLLPNFITVSNIQSKNPTQVKEGNEKVLRARLSDAQFFWRTDLKNTLESRVQKLESITFHAKLGSLMQRNKRIESLTGKVAARMQADQSIAEQGAKLCKADLVSDMVGEFDYLQGIMGRYYADLEGLPQGVGECIEQHYWPKFAGDSLPESLEAQSVSLADKLDSFVGLYGVGERPTGDKDPYGLRRAALSILRILIEKNHEFGLSELVSDSVGIYQEQQGLHIDNETQQEIVDFIRGRLTAFYQAQDIPTKTIQSVMACTPDSPLDFDQRVKAVNTFTTSNDAENLAAANKRISNLLKKQTHEISAQVERELLSEDSEIELNASIDSLEADCIKLFNAGDYEAGLAKLSTLRVPVDRFFDNVMVMTDDERLRNNRLSLLKRMQSLFLRVADIAVLG